LRTIARCAPRRQNCALYGPNWSQDGKHFAFVRGLQGGPIFGTSTMSLYVARSDGGAVQRLAGCGTCGVPNGGGLAWSPNGKWIAFSRSNGHSYVNSLWVVAAAGGSPRRLTGCPTCTDVEATWSPNGQLLLFTRTRGPTERIYSVRLDGSGLTEIADGADPQWSPDGGRIAFDSRDGIVVAHADGSDARLLVVEKGATGPGAPSWSPNGRKLLYVKTPPARGGLGYRFEIWTINADGSAKTRLYHAGCCTTGWGGPIWSPDGRLIAFSSDTGGGTFVMNADGTGVRRLSRATAGLSWQPLPKGRRK
jgi:Tol biopolymer transport system component